MSPESQRALVDEINKKTVEGKLRWEMVMNMPDPQAEFSGPETQADYYYCADLEDSTLYLYELDLSKPKQNSMVSAFSSFASIGARYAPVKDLNLFLVMRDLEGAVQLVVKGKRLLGDLMRSAGAKAGTPDSVAEELMNKLRRL